MNKRSTALLVSALSLASAGTLSGCGGSPESTGSTGAKPITSLAPGESLPSTSSASPETSVAETSSDTPSTQSDEPRSATPVDGIPRETDYNNADVEYVAESSIRAERMAQAAEIYLARGGTSEKGKAIAQRVKAQQSNLIQPQNELLTTWGIDNPQTVFPAHPAGIPTAEQVESLNSLEGKAADDAFLGLVSANLDGAVESARSHVSAGFHPEVKEAAQLVINEYEKEKASITEAQQV
ncbi:DUF305 domain-containing protein [Corynebacterium sp. H128]|uniref:DUF305 domain-containing protein n=1 Tax=unclassified Corynebacterium TaxID=2624378 RepID=UPI0030B02698